MWVFRSLTSVGAFLASIGGNNSGHLFTNNGHSASNNLEVTSCSADTIEITGSDLTNISPGQIIINLSEIDDESNANICTACGPIFRKVVAKSNNANENNGAVSFKTTFVSFAEVFPDQVFDESLADEAIEPLFKCKHTFERKLAQSDPILADFYQTEGGVAVAVSLLLLYCFSPCIILFGPFMAAALGVAAVGGAAREALGRRKLLEMDEEDDVEAAAFDSAFPTTCNEWMATDTNGNCLHVECNVGVPQVNDDNGSNCFHCSAEKKQSAGCKDKTNGMMDVLSVTNIHGVSYNFDDAMCIQEHCYSSNHYGKAICDSNVYRSMSTSCSVDMAATTTVSFPLTESTLSSNCQLVSVMFYLGMKLFGRATYEKSQEMQRAYAKGSCDRPVSSETIQF